MSDRWVSSCADPWVTKSDARTGQFMCRGGPIDVTDSIADWDSGKVLGVQKDRTYESLKAFFDSLAEKERKSIEAVAIDM